MSIFIKKKVDYFDIFINGAAISMDAAKCLEEALTNGKIDDEDILRIKKIKKNGSRHVDESLKIVDDAFITPIDQRDIIEILNGIEDILHSIESVANHMYIMRVERSDEFMISFVEIMNKMCQKIYDLMVVFKQIKKIPKENISSLISEIAALEEEGDAAYSRSMLHIFESETDAVILLKKKEIYKRFEYSLDCFKKVADMVGNLIVATM